MTDVLFDIEGILFILICFLSLLPLVFIVYTEVIEEIKRRKGEK